MKNTLFILLTVSFLAANAQNNNALLPKQLVIYDRIFFDTIPEYLQQEIIYKFRASIHSKFKNTDELDANDLLVKNLSEGKVDAYSDYSFYNNSGNFGDNSNINYQSVLLTREEIKSSLGYSVDTIEVYDENTDEYKNEILVKEIDKNSLQGYAFYDEWIIDEANFKMVKNVIAYSPVRVFFRGDDWGDELRPLYKTVGFIVLPDFQNNNEKTNVEKRMKLFKEVEYEFLLENTDMYMFKNEFSDAYSGSIENENTPLWNSYSRTKLRNVVMERVLSGRSDAFDYETKQKLGIDDIRKRSGERTDTLLVQNINDPDIFENIIVKTDMSNVINQIKSVIFIEDWYIDEKTLRIKKVVKGIIPVRWYYDEADYEYLNPLKLKLFKVNFNQ